MPLAPFGPGLATTRETKQFLGIEEETLRRLWSTGIKNRKFKQLKKTPGVSAGELREKRQLIALASDRESGVKMQLRYRYGYGAIPARLRQRGQLKSLLIVEVSEHHDQG
jgi:hypothetical protein